MVPVNAVPVRKEGAIYVPKHDAEVLCHANDPIQRAITAAEPANQIKMLLQERHGWTPGMPPQGAVQANGMGKQSERGRIEGIPSDQVPHPAELGSANPDLDGLGDRCA